MNNGAKEFNNFPRPLIDAINAFKSEPDNQYFRRVHRLIDLIEVFCKLYTVSSMATFIETLKNKFNIDNNKASETSLTKIKVMLAAGLRTPSLGIWWKFARDISSLLKELNISHILPNAEQELLNSKSFIKKSFDGENNLITFRNGYAHGATPSDEQCKEDIDKIWAQMQKLFFEVKSLQNLELLICKEDNKVYKVLTEEIIEHENNFNAKTNHIYFKTQIGLLDVYPLLSFKILNENKIDFLFYNDLKEKYANYLNYLKAEHYKDIDLRTKLLEYIPINEWKEISNVDMDPFRQQVEMLTEVFKGRKQELEQISEFITKPYGFLTIWGPPGVGKSALLARTTQILRYNEEIKEMLDDSKQWTQTKVHIVEYFIRRGATDNATNFFTNLNQRLDFMFKLHLDMGSSDSERQQQFTRRIYEASKMLSDNERLVIIIDGLDEIKTNDPLLSLLPRQLPNKVLVIYGARPKTDLKFTFYEQLDREHKEQFDLKGLSINEIRSVMMEHVSKYELEKTYIEEVLRISEGNPLYLKLLCQGLEQKIYSLNNIKDLPKGMNELYDGALFRLEKENPGSLKFLLFLSLAKNFVSAELASQWLEEDTIIVKNKLLYASLEFLYENPLTEKIEDYQLFHESMREYLNLKYPQDINYCQERICDWGIKWKKQNGDLAFNKETLFYAMRYTNDHLFESFNKNQELEQHRTADERCKQLFEIMNNDDWRKISFDACGNGDAIGNGYFYMQKIVAQKDKKGEKINEMFNYAINRYYEPEVKFENQRQVLLRPAKQEKLHQHLERVSTMAKMGLSFDEKILLALLTLWANDSKAQQLPCELIETIEEWLKYVQSTPIKKLWNYTKIIWNIENINEKCSELN